MWSDLRYRLRALFRRDTVERELADELQFHLEQSARQRQHHARDDADRRERAARADFGGLEHIKEECRDARGLRAVDHARQDVRYALRMFAKHRGFTLAVVGTLALGIGGATTMFALVDTVLLKPLPYRDADRIVRIGRTFGGVRVSATSAVDYAALASATARGSWSAVSASRTEAVDVTIDSVPERLAAAVVSASYFDVLGVPPSIGQLFAAEDDRPGARQVAIISDALWRRRFGASPAAAGRAILVNQQPHTIIGIMPRRFRGPEALGQDEVSVWLPLGRIRLPVDPDDASVTTIAAVRGDVDAATRALNGLGSELTSRYGGSPQSSRFWVAPLRAETVGDVTNGLWLLFGAVVVLLLIACVNVANLFLVRATERTREIAIRAALGAGRNRIARQLIVETLTFAFAGGAIGSLLAYGGVATIRAWAPADLPRITELQVDVRVLAFAFAVAAIGGLGFAVAPAFSARRTNLATAFRGSSTAITTSRARLRQRSVLVVIQTALAMMLVVGAGLLANSTIRLSRVDPGFDPLGLAWIDVTLPEQAYPGAAPKAAFFAELQLRARGTPGVSAFSIIQGRPLGGGNAISTVAPEGQIPAGADPPRVPFHVVAPGYFETLRIRAIDGRDFTDKDDTSAPRVAIVSRAFAQRFWPGVRAVGRRFWMGRISGDAPLTEVVGVVDDVRQYGLAAEISPVVYRPLAQVPRASATLMVRHDTGAAVDAIDRVRAVVADLDPALSLNRAGTMDAEVSRSIREPRFRALALSAFSLIACAIAAVGLYGALAWLVRARSRELGVRLALGADAGQVRRGILRRGIALGAAGIAIGLIAAAAASRLLASMMYGISALDLPTFAASGLVMLVVASAASWIPARRATAINPVELLQD